MALKPVTAMVQMASGCVKVPGPTLSVIVMSGHVKGCRSSFEPVCTPLLDSSADGLNRLAWSLGGWRFARGFLTLYFWTLSAAR